MIAHAHIRLTEATVRIRRVTVEVPFALDQRSGAGSGLGINRERKLALEKDIALNAETEGKLDRFQFLQRKAPQFRTAEAEIGEAKETPVLIQLRGQPGGGAKGIEEADNRHQVRRAFAAAKRLAAGDRRRVVWGKSVAGREK